MPAHPSVPSQSLQNSKVSRSSRNSNSHGFRPASPSTSERQAGATLTTTISSSNTVQEIVRADNPPDVPPGQRFLVVQVDPRPAKRRTRETKPLQADAHVECTGYGLNSLLPNALVCVGQGQRCNRRCVVALSFCGQQLANQFGRLRPQSQRSRAVFLQFAQSTRPCTVSAPRAQLFLIFLSSQALAASSPMHPKAWMHAHRIVTDDSCGSDPNMAHQSYANAQNLQCQSESLQARVEQLGKRTGLRSYEELSWTVCTHPRASNCRQLQALCPQGLD